MPLNGQLCLFLGHCLVYSLQSGCGCSTQQPGRGHMGGSHVTHAALGLQLLPARMLWRAFPRGGI